MTTVPPAMLVAETVTGESKKYMKSMEGTTYAWNYCVIAHRCSFLSAPTYLLLECFFASYGVYSEENMDCLSTFFGLSTRVSEAYFNIGLISLESYVTLDL